MEQLAALDWKNRRPGADLRPEAHQITRNSPELRVWLEESDRLALELPGKERLRRRRRLGILRHREGSRRGFPFFEPPFYPTKFAPEPREMLLKDELEVMVMPGRRDGMRWLPAKEELNFDEARAIASMKAGTLYRLSSKQLVPGMIRRSLGTDGRSKTGELRFRTAEFMEWAVVLATLVPKK